MRATQRQDVNESGAIAQLGERNTGSVEVSGSIPLSSTNNSLIFKEFSKRPTRKSRPFCFNKLVLS